MTEYRVTIPGHARGKQRARVTVRGGYGRAYTPKETLNAEAWVRQCCQDQVGSPCLDGPLSLRIVVWLGVPPSWPKKKQASALDGGLRPTGKPDLDNVAKLLADALNGILWRDDSQIVALQVEKHYGAAPSTAIAVRQITTA